MKMTSAALLLFLFSIVHDVTSSCTPIYPGCICQTKNLTCSDIAAINNVITAQITLLRGTNQTALKADPSHVSWNAGKFVGGVVRLAFHDASDYDPNTFAADGHRGDGCINLNSAENAGLNVTVDILDKLWMPFCNRISRGDFWYLAATQVINANLPYVQGQSLGYDFSNRRKLLRGASLHSHYVIPFRFGRIDRVPCVFDTPMRRHADAEGGGEQIVNFIMNKFGLDEKHSVALMGAHTLGHAEVSRSGYNSSWKDRPDLFTITYFKLLATAQWKRTAMVDPRTKAPLSQWNSQTGSKRNQFAFMLNTDMAMMYNASGSSTGAHKATPGDLCGPATASVDPGSIVLVPPNKATSSCPLLGLQPQNRYFNFSHWTLHFAEGDTATQDEPGASRWLLAFANAFRIMGEAGYAPSALTCSYCPPATCFNFNCSTKMLCETGALDNLTDSHYHSDPSPLYTLPTFPVTHKQFVDSPVFSVAPSASPAVVVPNKRSPTANPTSTASSSKPNTATTTKATTSTPSATTTVGPSSQQPTVKSSTSPSSTPTVKSSTSPSSTPTKSPSANPTPTPTRSLSNPPTTQPTSTTKPSNSPSTKPTTIKPSNKPTNEPSLKSTCTPTTTTKPTSTPSLKPSVNPNANPTAKPSKLTSAPK